MKKLLRRLLLGSMGLMAGAASAQTITVVTESNSDSYLQDGRVTGRATEVVESTLKRAQITDYKINVYPWARSQDLALREPNVLIYQIARTPEREDRFRWVGEIKRIQYFLYSLPGRTDLGFAHIEDARASNIGVVRDDVRQQYFMRRGFTRLTVSAQPMENLRKLLYRQVDMIALTEPEAQSLCNEARPECTGLTRVGELTELRSGLYMAYSLATPEEVVGRTRTAFETVRADGSLARIMGSAPPARLTSQGAAAAPARRAGN